jgi:hypothetical protein
VNRRTDLTNGYLTARAEGKAVRDVCSGIASAGRWDLQPPFSLSLSRVNGGDMGE